MLYGTSLTQKNVQDHTHPHFSSASGKWKHREERRMRKRISFWRYNNSHLTNNALLNLMDYSTTPYVCPKPVYPHPNFQFICIIWVWPETRNEDGANHIGHRRLSLAWKYGTARASSRVRASWIQRWMAWNCGGTSSQSRDRAKQKGGEQVATWLKREPGFQDSPISKLASFPNDLDIWSFVLSLCKDSTWDEAQSQSKDLPATMA